MNELEKAALKHAADERRYRRSPQAAIDRAADAKRRADADKAAGHLPTCSLTRCAPECKHS